MVGLSDERISILIHPLSPHDELKHHFTSLKTYLIFLQLARGFRIKNSMRLFYQYMASFFNFSPTSSHHHPLQVENCDSNSRLVVDENDYGKFRLQRVKLPRGIYLTIDLLFYKTNWMRNIVEIHDNKEYLCFYLSSYTWIFNRIRIFHSQWGGNRGSDSHLIVNKTLK